MTPRDLDAAILAVGALILCAVVTLTGAHKFIGPAGLIAGGIFYAIATCAAFTLRHKDN